MSGEGIESVDEKLTAAFERREKAQDDRISPANHAQRTP